MNRVPFDGANVNQINDFSPMYVENLATFDTLALTRIYPPAVKLNLKGFSAKDELRVRRYRNKGKRQIVTAMFELDDLLKTEGIYHSNTQSDINDALEIVTRRVTALLGVRFDAPSAFVTVCDANRDFYVPGEKEKYLVPVSKHYIPRTTKEIYHSDDGKLTGVKFYCKTRSVEIYDKFAELLAKHPEMNRRKRLMFQRILRTELSETKYALRRSVRDFFGSSERTAEKILTVEFAEYLVRRSLADLQLDADVFSFDNHAERICAAFKTSTAKKLIAFVADINGRGVEQVKAALDRNKFNYRKKLLADAGLWQSYFADEELLESLDNFPPDDRLIEW